MRKDIESYNKARALFLSIEASEPAWRVSQSAWPLGLHDDGKNPYRYLQLIRECPAEESSVPLDEARGLAIGTKAATVTLNTYDADDKVTITIALAGVIDPADPVVIAAVAALAAKPEAGRAA